MIDTNKYELKDFDPIAAQRGEPVCTVSGIILKYKGLRNENGSFYLAFGDGGLHNTRLYSTKGHPKGIGASCLSSLKMLVEKDSKGSSGISLSCTSPTLMKFTPVGSEYFRIYPEDAKEFSEMGLKNSKEVLMYIRRLQLKTLL